MNRDRNSVLVAGGWADGQEEASFHRVIFMARDWLKI
jgi:hypothetical protein